MSLTTKRGSYYNSTMIETNRLRIRKFTEKDLEAFAHLMSNPLVMEFSLKGRALDQEESRFYLKTRILDHYKKRDYGLWALIEKKTDALVGLAGLLHQKLSDKEYVELAYRLHPDHWNRGLATEACRSILDYARDHYQLSELISMIDPANLPSIKLSKKLGFNQWKKTTFHEFEVLIFKKQLTKGV